MSTLKKYLAPCIGTEPPYSVSVHELKEKSSGFPHKFPTNSSRCERLLKEKILNINVLKENINSCYPLLDETALPVFCEFLEYKKNHGSNVERELYRGMGLVDFIQRLLQKRAVAFHGTSDDYLLMSAKRGSRGWEKVGQDNQSAPLLLKDCLSYDEIKLSALLGLSSPSLFFSSDNLTTGNRASIQSDASLEADGVAVGIACPRLDKKNFMDWQDILITKDQNVESNGYGDSISKFPLKKIWSNFYEQTCFPTYEDVSSITEALGFTRLPRNVFFNNNVYKARIVFIVQTLLAEANHRAAHYGKRAYIHIPLDGLNISPAKKEQFVEVFAEVCQRSDMKNIADIHFECSDSGTCDKLSSIHSNTRFHFSERSPMKKHFQYPNDMLLVVYYPLNANALPGNEYWDRKLGSSIESTVGCCSQITEFQNPHLNRKICGSNVHISSSVWGVLHISEYAKRKLQHSEDEGEGGIEKRAESESVQDDNSSNSTGYPAAMSTSSDAAETDDESASRTGNYVNSPTEMFLDEKDREIGSHLPNSKKKQNSTDDKALSLEANVLSNKSSDSSSVSSGSDNEDSTNGGNDNEGELKYTNEERSIENKERSVKNSEKHTEKIIIIESRIDDIFTNSADIKNDTGKTSEFSDTSTPEIPQDDPMVYKERRDDTPSSEEEEKSSENDQHGTFAEKLHVAGNDEEAEHENQPPEGVESCISEVHDTTSKIIVEERYEAEQADVHQSNVEGDAQIATQNFYRDRTNISDSSEEQIWEYTRQEHVEEITVNIEGGHKNGVTVAEIHIIEPSSSSGSSTRSSSGDIGNSEADNKATVKTAATQLEEEVVQNSALEQANKLNFAVLVEEEVQSDQVFISEDMENLNPECMNNGQDTTNTSEIETSNMISLEVMPEDELNEYMSEVTETFYSRQASLVSHQPLEIIEEDEREENSIVESIEDNNSKAKHDEISSLHEDENVTPKPKLKESPQVDNSCCCIC